MSKKYISQRKIEKAIIAINGYYDKMSDGNHHITKDFLTHNKICSPDEVDMFISRLEGLGLIDYSEYITAGVLAITRLPPCITYFENKKAIAKQTQFSKITSIISLIISAIALIKSFFPNFSLAELWEYFHK